MDGEINNIIILSISAIKNFFSNQFKSSKWAPHFCPKSEKLVFKQDNFFP